MKPIAIFFLLTVLSAAALAQVAEPAPNVSRPQSAAGAPLAAEPASAPLDAILGQLQQTIQAANLDLAKLRIERWKADASVKRQAQDNADSISRNLTAALPGMVQQARSDPQSLAAVFKLYRTLNVLYDVFINVTESAGAFGQKAEYDALARDAQGFDSARRGLADHLQEMASARDAEILRLRTRIAQVQAAPPPPPTKIVVDEEPPKKPVHKKKSTSTTKPAAKPQTAAPVTPSPKQ